jgi:Flp pilus assembly protein TadG
MRLAIGNQRGQALVETGLVVTMLVMLTICIIEFGRAFMVANMVGHAARDAARAAAVSVDRNASGFLNPTAKDAITTQAKAEIGVVMAQSQITGGLCGTGVCFDQQPPAPVGVAIPTVKVTLTGSIPLIFNLIGTSIPISRTATFRDEGR